MKSAPTTLQQRSIPENQFRLRRATVALIATVIGLGASALASAGVANAHNGSCSGTDGPHGLPAGIFTVKEFSMQNAANQQDYVVVEAYAAMPQNDAQLFVDRPGDEAIFRLWGDDVESDDHLATFRPERYWAYPGGLGMRGFTLVPDSTMDEDSFPEVEDELYVGIRLTDIRNGSEHKVETCDLSLAF